MIDLRSQHTIINLQADNEKLKLEIKNQEKIANIRIKNQEKAIRKNLFKEDREKRVRAARLLNENRKELNISTEDVKLFLHVSDFDLYKKESK